MKNIKIRNIIILMLAAAFLFSCNGSDTATVTVQIDLGLKEKNAFNEQKSSIFDTIFRLITRDAIAETAPSNITSLKLNVTGPGMSAINKQYSASTSLITLEIPAGNSRLIEILADTPSATLRGSTTRNLVGGEVVNITLKMGLYDTKIVIPDYRNNRIVQIDNMKGDGWKINDGSAFQKVSQGPTFFPYDIDFDSLGRIYIIDDEDYLDDIIRIDDITSSSYEPLVAGGRIPFTAIGIDRKQKIMYAATDSSLYKYSLNGVEDVNFNPELTLTNIRGIAVGQDSTVYVGGALQHAAVQKYNPENNTLEASYEISHEGEIWDVIVKAPYLYISIYDENNDYDKIIRLNLDLTNPKELSGNSKGSFYGPHRFVARLKSSLYIIDDGYDFNEEQMIKRIIEIEDIDGNGWNIFAPIGTFQFYEQPPVW